MVGVSDHDGFVTTYLTHVISKDEYERLDGDRARLRQGSLGADEIALLDEISPGWSLSKLDHSWNRSAISATAFYKSEMRHPLPYDGTNAELGTWLNVQRKRLKNKNLRHDRRVWLDENYPAWTITTLNWAPKAGAAADFYEREGRHPSADSENHDEKVLGAWLENQRSALKGNTLAISRRWLLDERYPDWSGERGVS